MDKNKFGIYIQGNIFLGLKKNEILVYATTWMNLDNIIVNEISQT